MSVTVQQGALMPTARLSVALSLSAISSAETRRSVRRAEVATNNPVTF